MTNGTAPGVIPAPFSYPASTAQSTNIAGRLRAGRGAGALHRPFERRSLEL